MKGIGVAGTIMSADNYLDRIFDGNTQKFGLGDNTANSFFSFLQGPVDRLGINTNSLLVPMAFIGNIKAWETAGIGLAAVFAGKYIDKAFNENLPEHEQKKYSNLFRPNGIDAFGITGALMLPVTNPLVKGGLVLGAWAAGRWSNYTSGQCNLRYINDAAWGSLKDDAASRSDRSMNAAVDKSSTRASRTGQTIELVRHRFV